MSYYMSHADFSGGLVESLRPEANNQAEWSRLYGFVLDNTLAPITQPALERVGVETDFEWIRALQCSVNNYLIGKRANGKLYYIVTPSDSTYYPDLEFFWTLIYSPGDDPITPDFVGYLTYGDTLGAYDNALVFREGNREKLKFITEVDGELVVKSYSADVYPKVSTTDDALGTDGIVPWGRVACMWGNFAVIADTYWFRDPSEPMSATNYKYYPNGIWITQKGSVGIDQFHPVDSFNILLDPGARIMAMQPLDAGLLIVTEPVVAGGTSGTILLRGTGDNFVVDKIRTGLGTKARNSVDLWPETGAALFVSSEGQAWHTGGSSDTTGRLDEVGPKPARRPTDADCMTSHNEYVILSRRGRLLCLKLDEEFGAWTELITPYPGEQVTSLLESNNSTFFVQDGRVWRYNWLSALRGMKNDQLLTLEVGTSTFMASENEHDTEQWHRVGLTVSGHANGLPNVGKLVSIKSLDGPVLKNPIVNIAGEVVLNDTEVYHEQVFDQELTDRGDYVSYGHGVSPEASALIKLQGDVTIESVGFWVASRRPYRGPRTSTT